jgi:uncharacterized repeat protein (TIGR03803 family)
MKRTSFYAFCVAVATAFLSGCGFSQGRVGLVPAQNSADIVRQSVSHSYQVLYRFDPHMGEQPQTGLTELNGALYGTAFAGGMIGCHDHRGCGTVYTIASSGAVTALVEFDRERGINPLSPVIDINGTLYGTTEWGGPNHYGTFYSVTPSGSEAVLFNFHREHSDGQQPDGSLLNINGTLYGVTIAGGRVHGDHNCQGCGTVYSITTAGAEHVLYRFKGGPDGRSPLAGLIEVKGTLYGTTSGGGIASGACSDGCGTVYSITPQGSYKQLYAFRGGSGDGANPSSVLLNINGTLYGTTRSGGGGGCNRYGCGTVFTITPSGAEHALHSFAAGSDGARPYSRLIDVKGTLYGTTTEGGNPSACYDAGCGTVYSITTTGAEKVVYSFAGGSDGSAPRASLVDIKGTLYGTTTFGGKVAKGEAPCCGTIFALSP